MRIARLFLVTLFSFGFLAGSALAQDGKYQLPKTDEGLPGVGPIRRYDWFRGLWQRKRKAFAAATQKDQGAVVFLGDSITQGWKDLATSFGDLKVANRGISGDTTRGMLIRLKEDVLDVNPKCVVMLMGTNDLEENAKPAMIAGNVKLIIEELGKHNAKMPIVLCQVMPSSASKKRSEKDITETNKLCAAAVRGNTQVTVVDTWTLFANAEGDAKKEEFPDLLHPNAAGYAKWAAALRPVFATLKLTETAADTFVVETGFEPLFNGKDLTGWMFKATPEGLRKRWERQMKNNPAKALPRGIVEKDENFKGKASSSDGRYQTINGRLVVTTPTEGRRIQQLWTTQEFGEDFVLKLEFRATPNADSGVFIRGKQLQCRDFLLAGPYKKLTKYRPQLWNELVINVKGTKAHCTCNGEVLEQAFDVPATGPIGLEGDRGQIEYRRIRIGKDDGNLLATTARPESWRLETHDSGRGSMKTDGAGIEFKTEEVTDTDWHVQAYQQGLSLEEGKQYKVSFQMKSPDYSTLVVMAMSHAPDDYHPIGLAEEFQTDPTFSDFEFTFTATDVIEGKSRIGFILGRDTGTVVLKNLKMVEVE